MTRENTTLTECPVCGEKVMVLYGLAGGGMGVYFACIECDWIEKPEWLKEKREPQE